MDLTLSTWTDIPTRALGITTRIAAARTSLRVEYATGLLKAIYPNRT